MKKVIVAGEEGPGEIPDRLAETAEELIQQIKTTSLTPKQLESISILFTKLKNTSSENHDTLLREWGEEYSKFSKQG